MDDESSISISRELDGYDDDSVCSAPGVDDMKIAESKVSTATMTLPGGGISQTMSMAEDFYDQCMTLEAEGTLSFVNINEYKEELPAGITMFLRLYLPLSSMLCTYIVHVCVISRCVSISIPYLILNFW